MNCLCKIIFFFQAINLSTPELYIRVATLFNSAVFSYTDHRQLKK